MVQVREFDWPRAVRLLLRCWRLRKHGCHTSGLMLKAKKTNGSLPRFPH
jgi:hypothetical protein